jgi:hypothetical protein
MTGSCAGYQAGVVGARIDSSIRACEEIGEEATAECEEHCRVTLRPQLARDTVTS